MDNEYSKLDFKIPKESNDYEECSRFVIEQIKTIIKYAKQHFWIKGE